MSRVRQSFAAEGDFEAQLDRWEEAFWDYQLAVNLDPTLVEFEFSEYPNLASRFLQAREEHEEVRSAIARHGGGLVVVRPKLATPAPTVKFKKAKHADPHFPAACRKAQLAASVELYIVINESGIPRTPVFPRTVPLPRSMWLPLML